MLSRSRTRSARLLEGPAWRGRVAVVSPHLDDGVFSLGVSMRAATRAGASVDVVTILAGKPASETPADDSNRRAGFATAGEAARARRQEDRRGCEAVGARPVWLDLSDDRNDEVPEEELRQAIAQALAGYDAVLIPGFPIAHPDHVRVSRLALEVVPAGRPLGLYVEQPYASWNALARARRPGGVGSRDGALAHLGLAVHPAPRWTRELGTPADWAAKLRGISAYESQLRVLRRGPRIRILAYEAVRRGESVLWLSPE